eukprot:7307040-Ditylum_brightwellii.AAC.1
MDQSYGTRIHGGMRSRKNQTLIPSKFQGFSNTTTAKIQRKGKCNCLRRQRQRKKPTREDNIPHNTKMKRRHFTPTLANNIAAFMKKKGIDIPKYIRMQGHVHHQNRPRVKLLVDNPVKAITMTQYHVSTGLKVFGKDGFAALDKEL